MANDQLIFERFKSDLPEEQCIYVKKILNHYILGIFISRSGGDILYSLKVDPSIRVELISQFIAALSMFGEENVGKIKRIFIEGIDVELSIISKHDLIVATFFRPHMVTDYLEAESTRALELFYEKFKEPLTKNKCNRSIYETFDDTMCHLIQDYLIKIKVIEGPSC